MKELDDIYINIEELKKLPKNSKDYKDYCYLIYDAYRDDKETLLAICSELGIDIRQFLDFVDRHKKDVKDSYQLMIDAYNKKMIYMNTGHNKKYEIFLKEILNAKTKDEIIAVYQKYDKKYYRSIGIFGHIINMYPNKNEANRIFNEYNKRKYIYKTYLREIRREKLEKEREKHLKEKEELALVLADRILADNDLISLNGVVEKYHLSPGSYKYVHDIWLEHNLYHKIITKLTENRSRIFNQKYKDLIEKILPLMDKNSITIGNRKRTIDLFDCYTYFEKDFQAILETCRNFYSVDNDDTLTKNRLGILKNLLGRSGNTLPAQIESADIEAQLIEKILKEKHETDYSLTDEHGFVVPGSGHILTNEEKMDIIKIMKEKHIPINRGMYELAIRRWHNGYLELITQDTIDDYLKQKKTK